MATVKHRPVRFLMDEERELMRLYPTDSLIRPPGNPDPFCPITNERILAMDTEITRLRGALDQVMDELGVPNKDYPAPVANAWNIAKGALNVGVEGD